MLALQLDTRALLMDFWRDLLVSTLTVEATTAYDDNTLARIIHLVEQAQEEKGKAQCAKCHSVNKEGGRVGPALDRLANRRAPEYIMESIVQPSKDIDPDFEAVTVVTLKGTVITGLRVNESNFSIQLREENGR